MSPDSSGPRGGRPRPERPVRRLDRLGVQGAGLRAASHRVFGGRGGSDESLSIGLPWPASTAESSRLPFPRLPPTSGRGIPGGLSKNPNRRIGHGAGGVPRTL